MKNSTKVNHAVYLSLSKAAEAMDDRATLLDAILNALLDGSAETFDLDAAGTILSELESLVFQLRASMYKLQNSVLPDDGGALKDLLIELAIDVCEMRDTLMDFLDELFCDVDAVFDKAMAETEAACDDDFYVRVPADSDIEIDGTPCDFSDCADETGFIEIPVGPDETLTVDGEEIDTGGCEPGEVYNIINDEDGAAGEELADDEFMVWIPGGSVIAVNGDSLIVEADDMCEDGSVCLALREGDSLTVDGNGVDLCGCKPGVEYDLTAAN